MDNTEIVENDDITEEVTSEDVEVVEDTDIGGYALIAAAVVGAGFVCYEAYKYAIKPVAAKVQAKVTELRNSKQKKDKAKVVEVKAEKVSKDSEKK